MNKSEFSDAIRESLNFYDVDFQFIARWNKSLIESLENIKRQAGNLKHPRHLGDFLESELVKTLRILLPQHYLIDKGFLINSRSSFSPEQDILVVDTALGGAICKTDGIGYYPIESAIGAIEVKSNLDLSELRKCFVSCVNAKKLYFDNFDYEKQQEVKFFYAIFAYTSSCKLANFEKELNGCIEHIPEALRPNLIYILDYGLYFPTKDGNIVLDLKSVQEVEQPYKAIRNVEGQNTDSMNFGLFFSLFIEHAFQQSLKRAPTKYSHYIIMPSMWEDKIVKSNPDRQGPIRKIANKYRQLPHRDGTYLIPIFEEKCPVCAKSFQFYVLPPDSKNARKKLETNLVERGVIPMPELRRYRCQCGTVFSIKEE